MFSFFSFFVRERSREIKLIIEKSFHWIIRVAKINDDDQTNIQMIRYNSEDQITKVENVCTSMYKWYNSKRSIAEHFQIYKPIIINLNNN